MTQKQKNPRSGCAGQSGATHEKNPTSYFSKKLSLRQIILLQTLLSSPNGVLSNKLRERLQTNNVHNYVKQLRETGLLITCEMVGFEGDFGPGKIGLLRLAPESRKQAVNMLGG